jgi:hypothetical protein
MKRLKLLFITLIALCSLLPALLQAQVDTAWVRRYYTPGNAPDYATAIAVDGRGNVYVTGFSGTNADYTTIKYGPDGDSLWVRRYNGPANGSDDARAIAVDAAGNVYVTGESYGGSTVYDYATIKYSPSGVERWVARYNGPANFNDDAQAIALDDAGNVYVTGSSSGSGTSDDYATVKYDSSGAEQWARRYNGPGNSYDYALAIAVDARGNAYVTGRSTGSGTEYDYATIKYSPAGESLWTRRYDDSAHSSDGATAIAVDGSGNVYVTGNWINGTGADYLTIKYDSAGGVQWARGYDGPANAYDGATAIAVDDSGYVYVTGQSQGITIGYATVKYSPSGAEQWAVRYDGPPNQNDYARAIAVDAAGSVYVTGESYGFSFDYATVKYGPSGESLWVQRYNGPGSGNDYATAIAVDDSGSVYVTGRSNGLGNYDYVTIKYVQTQSGIEENRLPPSADRIPFVIYPNPAKSVIRVCVPLTSKDIKIFDVSGNLVKEITSLPKTDRNYGEEVISLKGINPGIYFFRLGTETRKFLVIR